MSKGKTAIIVGAGPAGLYCADQLLKNNWHVQLFDHSSGIGKKFLVAGNGGLNLTHSEGPSTFVQKYGDNEEIFENILSKFSPEDLRQWCNELGVETFIGTSGRVFPKNLKAAEILIKLKERLQESDHFKLALKTKLIAINKERQCTFESIGDGDRFKEVADVVILALGGGSWKKTGSDGAWVDSLKAIGIKVSPLKPMNCGFEHPWSQHFLDKVERLPLKNIGLTFNGESRRSEIMITSYGIEGTGIYALSKTIADEIDSCGQAIITIDLKPDWSSDFIKEKFLNKNKKDSMTNFLRKSLRLTKDQSLLVMEFLIEKKDITSEEFVSTIKELDVKLIKARPIDEAISTSGGVCFSELDDNLQSRKINGLFFAGEMLDFEAPTGGYLLQGAFSTAHTICDFLNKDDN